MFNFGMKKKTLTVDGMTCHHCEMTVEKALLQLEGVKSVKADHESKRVEVQYKDELDLDRVRENIEKAGYKFISEN